MKDAIQTISQSGLVPVVILHDANHAVPLAHAFLAGGLNSMEITLRTPAGIESIRRVAQEVPDMMVGAGTVHSVDTAQQAEQAGAQFIVTPGFSRPVVTWCLERGIPVMPGVSTPTEVETALELGLTTLKFFPAEQSGGIAMLKAFQSPYSQVKFMPTGGINATNLTSYLRLPNVLACGGSWVCPASLVEQENFPAITQLCREAMELVHTFKPLHVSLNCGSDACDLREIGQFLRSARSPVSCPNGAVLPDSEPAAFAGQLVLGVYNMERAAAYLQERGWSCKKEAGEVRLQETLHGWTVLLRAI